MMLFGVIRSVSVVVAAKAKETPSPLIDSFVDSSSRLFADLGLIVRTSVVDR